MKGAHDIINATRRDNDTLRLNLLKHVMRCPLFRSRRRQHSFLLITSVILILSTLVGCGPSTEDLETVDYTPLPGDDWEASTPAEQGLDPMLVAELYHITDPRKEQITIQHLLQLRAGYPWEESDPALWEALLEGGTATTAGRLLRLIVEFPHCGA